MVKRHRSYISVDVDTSVDVYIDDIIGDIETEALVAELQRRNGAVVDAAGDDREFLVALADAIHSGRSLARTESLMTSARLRSIAEGHERAEHIRDAYEKWQRARTAPAAE